MYGKLGDDVITYTHSHKPYTVYYFESPFDPGNEHLNSSTSFM